MNGWRGLRARRTWARVQDKGVFVEAGCEKGRVDLVEEFDGYRFMEEAQKGGFMRTSGGYSDSPRQLGPLREET